MFCFVLNGRLRGCGRGHNWCIKKEEIPSGYSGYFELKKI